MLLENLRGYTMNLYTKLTLPILIMLPIFGMEEGKKQYASHKTKSIVHVKHTEGVHFDSNGHFASGADAISFLEKAAHEGKISDSFKDIKKAQVLAKEAKIARWATEQLFLIKCKNGNSYIVKEIKQDKNPRAEIDRLERARTSKPLQRYIHPNKTDSLRFVFPSSYVRYKHDGKEHILVIMTKARGKSLQSLMEKFRHNPHDNKLIALMGAAYYDLGMAMAKFYQKQGTLDSTVIHKDFHHGNIFYELEHRLVTLIDNERICKTLKKPSDISSDLSHLFVTSPFVIEWSNSGFLKDMDLKQWYTITLPSFIFGFMRAYPQQERTGIFEKLTSLLLKWNTAVKRDDSREIRGIIKEVLTMNGKNSQNLERQLLAEGKTELHIAAGNPDLTTLVDIMLGEKTKAINKKDLEGNTPLHEAAYYGCLESAKLLCDAHSNVNAHNNNGETPLFKAQYQNNQALINLLQKS
jgi:hypothetical protein